jgi:hypothetical protein
LAVLFFVLSGIGAARADLVHVEKTNDPALVEEDQTIAFEMVKSILRTDRHEVSSKATYTLKPRIERRGTGYVFTLERIESGRVKLTNQMAATTNKDLGIAATRVVRATVAGKSIEKNPESGQLTPQESRDFALNRPKRVGPYVTVGPAVLTNMGTGSIAIWGATGYGFDANPLLIRIGAEYAGAGATYLALAGVGGTYFFRDEDMTPFFMADVDYGGAANAGGSGTNTYGVLVGVGGGIQFRRTHQVNIELGLRYTTMIGNGWPGFIGLRLGIYL